MDIEPQVSIEQSLSNSPFHAGALEECRPSKPAVTSQKSLPAVLTEKALTRRQQFKNYMTSLIATPQPPLYHLSRKQRAWNMIILQLRDSSLSWKYGTLLFPYNLFIAASYASAGAKKQTLDDDTANHDASIIYTLFWWGVLPLLLWAFEPLTRTSVGPMVSITSTGTSAIMNFIMVIIGFSNYFAFRNSVDDGVESDLHQLPGKIALGIIDILLSVFTVLLFAFAPVKWFDAEAEGMLYQVVGCFVGKEEKDEWVALWGCLDNSGTRDKILVFVLCVAVLVVKAFISFVATLVGLAFNENPAEALNEVCKVLGVPVTREVVVTVNVAK